MAASRFTFRGWQQFGGNFVKQVPFGPSCGAMPAVGLPRLPDWSPVVRIVLDVRGCARRAYLLGRPLEPHRRSSWDPSMSQHVP